MKRKVACLLAEGFEDSEFKQPVDRLIQEGFEVDIIGSHAQQKLTGKKNKESTTTHLAIADADISNYMALLIPGGQSPKHLMEDHDVVDFVRAFAESDKPIAAICHGPLLLAAAGVIKGKRLTGFAGIHQALTEAGAEVVDEAVATDGSWITSRTPDDLPQFCEAIALQFGTNANQSWMARGDVHPAAP